MKKLRTRFKAFISTNKQYPFLIALASGLYPLLYYYNANYTLINSWGQFTFFVALFLIFPTVIFYLIYFITRKIDLLQIYKNHIFTVLNFSWFGFLLLLITKGIKVNFLVIILFSALCLGIIFRKHLNKIIVLQLFLAAFVSLQLVPDIYKNLTYSDAWKNQPDDIETVVLKERPNIYVIQPDGYASFSELRKPPYNFDNSDFEKFLDDKKFKLYPEFRSNYFSTLSSNSSMFSMKHHYYNNPNISSNEVYNSRDHIVGENPVLSILKKNDYKTFLLLHKSYLLVNRPKLAYDYCNIDYSELSFFARGFNIDKKIEEELAHLINENTSTNNFFFIEQISPGHISTLQSNSSGIELERELYLKKLKEANKWLKNTISSIEENDKNAIVIILADHGGFVGLEYTMATKIKQDNDDLVKTVFTTAFAVKWPDGIAPKYDSKLKTNVNLFRILFTYLSGNESYLKNLQEDKSYITIHTGAPFGVYENIDENGNVVFNRHSN